MNELEFNLEDPQFTEDGFVYRKGLIFRADKYSDKNFEMSPEELLAAANEFQPVPLDVEHMPSIFDSKLGSLLAIEPSEDGWELYGVAKIPKWLNDVHGDTPLKVSCTWDRATKKLSKLALVKNPRVGDAALMAAFTTNELETSSDDDKFKSTVLTYLKWIIENNSGTAFGMDYGRKSPGVYVLQSIHDSCASSGAICDPNNVETDDDDEEDDDKPRNGMLRGGYNFVSKKESEIIQRIHDLTVKQGAKCYASYNSNKKTREESKMSLKEIIAGLTNLSRQLPEETSELSAETATAAPSTVPVEQTEEFKSLQAKLDEVQNALATLSAEKAAIEDGKAQAEAEKAQAEKALLEAEANKFAEELVAGNKITPSSSEFAKKLFLVSKTSNVSFNDEESLFDIIKGLFDSLATHNFTDEVMEDVAVLGAKPVKLDEIEEARKLAEEYAAKQNKQTKSGASQK